MRFALLLLVATSTVYADDPRVALRKAAEQAEKDAKQSKDIAKYVACGNLYMEIANKFPDSDSDEVLYNAGVCFEEGKSVGVALQTYKLLMRQFPASKLRPRALARTAKVYAEITQFDRAAEALEEYADKYAGEKDAYYALSDATMYRRAIGDREKAIANTNRFVKTFFRQKPAEALQAMLTLTPLFDDDREKQLAHLLTVVNAHKLDYAQKALVHKKIGDLRSAMSCPVALQEGLCIKLERDRGATKARCAKDPVRVVAVKRTGAYKDALAAYAAAEKAAANVRGDTTTRYHAAMAKLALADAHLEDLLRKAPPTAKGLDAWFGDATTQAKTVNEMYEAIIALGDAQSSLVAAARLGQTAQAVSRTLRLAAVANDTQCKAVDELAAPVAVRAADAFDVCLQKAATFGVHDAYSRMCSREGRLLDAQRFRAADIHPEPSAIAIPMIADKIGEADWRAGRKSEAIKAWEVALAKDGKLFAPRINLAIARLDELRAMPAGDPARKQLMADITLHAQTAAAVEHHPAPFVVLGALAVEDKKQHELAKLLFELAQRETVKYAPAHVGLGVLAVRRDQWSTAVAALERAAELDDTSDSIRLAVALAYLRVGRYDAAAEKLAAIKTATYDVELARGVAARALGKLDVAKAAYQRAIKLDATRTEAAQNLASLRP